MGGGGGCRELRVRGGGRGKGWGGGGGLVCKLLGITYSSFFMYAYPTNFFLFRCSGIATRYFTLLGGGHTPPHYPLAITPLLFYHILVLGFGCCKFSLSTSCGINLLTNALIAVDEG